VTLTVTEAVLLLLLRVTEDGEAVHFGAGVALVAIEQAKLTFPVKPFVPVTVLVKVVEEPESTVAEAGFGAESEKLAACVTVTVTVL